MMGDDINGREVYDLRKNGDYGCGDYKEIAGGKVVIFICVFLWVGPGRSCRCPNYEIWRG
jgi:hypothetical protein